MKPEKNWPELNPGLLDKQVAYQALTRVMYRYWWYSWEDNKLLFIVTHKLFSQNTVDTSRLQEKVIDNVKPGHNNDNSNLVTIEQIKFNIIDIGVYKPQDDGPLQTFSLQKYMTGVLNKGNIEAISIIRRRCKKI